MDDLTYYSSRLLALADPHAKRHVMPAFYGDADAALSLCCALRNDLRGVAAVFMWKAGVARQSMRALLAKAWNHDHDYVQAAAGTRRRLASMFRYANFDVPEWIPETVRVWRGVHGVGLRTAEAISGHSWTLDRDVACWFAFRHSQAAGVRSLVVTAVVERSKIAMYDDSRDEREIVLMHRPPGASLDPDPRDWARCAADLTTQNDAKRMASSRPPRGGLAAAFGAPESVMSCDAAQLQSKPALLRRCAVTDLA